MKWSCFADEPVLVELPRSLGRVNLDSWRGLWLGSDGSGEGGWREELSRKGKL